MRDENIQKMSESTADALFGQPATVNDFERDLYELHKLADRVLEAVAAGGAQELAFRGADPKSSLSSDPPALEFTLPMPSWDEA